MLEKSKALFSQWNDSNLRYCHWKSNEHLVAGLDGETDLDVLLCEEDRKTGSDFLRKNGFLCCYSQFGSRYPNVEDWLGLDEETGRLLHIHLHYSLVTGHLGLKEYDLPWTEECLRTRCIDDSTGVYIADPNLELLTLYTRLILKSHRKSLRLAKDGRYRMSESFSVEIDYIKQFISREKVAAIIECYFRENAQELTNIICSETFTSESYVRLYAIVTKTMRSYSRYHGLGLMIRKFYYSLCIRGVAWLRHNTKSMLITRKVINPRGGVSIAFVGQDGSGKSTVTNDIQRWLTWKLDASRFYLGSGDHYNSLLKRLLVHRKRLMISNDNDLRNRDLGKKENSMRSNNGAKSLLRAIILVSQMLAVARRAYREVRRAERYRRHGGIPLFDRFPQIQFEGIYDGPKISEWCKKNAYDGLLFKWFARIEQSYIEKCQSFSPNLLFKLQLSPEESIRRKPKDDAKTIVLKHELTKILAFPGAREVIVDAEQDYSRELLQIKREIWQHLLQNQ